MSSNTRTVPTLATIKDVDQAVKRYKNSDLSDKELISLWQAIHDASLELASTQLDTDEVPGEDSY